jgi:hypothetical protein
MAMVSDTTANGFLHGERPDEYYQKFKLLKNFEFDHLVCGHQPLAIGRLSRLTTNEGCCHAWMAEIDTQYTPFSSSAYFVLNYDRDVFIHDNDVTATDNNISTSQSPSQWQLGLVFYEDTWYRVVVNKKDRAYEIELKADNNFNMARNTGHKEGILMSAIILKKKLSSEDLKFNKLELDDYDKHYAAFSEHWERTVEPQITTEPMPKPGDNYNRFSGNRLQKIESSSFGHEYYYYSLMVYTSTFDADVWHKFKNEGPRVLS